MLKYSLPTRIRLEIFRRLKYGLFMIGGRRRARRLREGLDIGSKPLFLTVAFNEPNLTRAQIEAFRRECEQDCVFLLADNSPSKALSRQFKEVADQTNATYVRLPYNLYTNSKGAAKPGRGSLSHSVALNWVWRYIVQPLNPSAVAVLDHDVFPLARFSVDDILGERLAVGPIREGASRWTTWPGLTFLRFRELANKKLSFTPSGDLDSGAGLWDCLYQEMDRDKEVRIMPRSFIDVLESDVGVKSQIEIIDGMWLHLIDGSGWFDGVGKADALASDPTTSRRLPASVVKILKEISSKESL